MKRKSNLTIVLTVIFLVSIFIIGCGRNNSADNDINGGNTGGTNTAGDTKDDEEKNEDYVVDSAKDNVEEAGDSLKYSAMNFKDDLVGAGYNLKESTNSKKDYFKGTETDYLASNDIIRVVEYNSATDLENDIKRIAPNGLSITGTEAKYTRAPYYYRKGNSLIMYEGNEPEYVDQLNTMYGNTLIPTK